MSNFNWQNIRSYNNSQNNAFEELVCQLAREEDILDKKSFIRIGAPDGGVEAYCVLDNGDEYGWQAKYFSAMGPAQWKQIEHSFKTALEKRHDLTKYYICIPLDRQSPGIPNEKWFMDKWNEKVVEWGNYAKSKGRRIEFEYWGSSELLDRLSLEKHAGRRYFWFNQLEFSDEWFAERLNGSIADLGNRYTPELNFELDIAKTFDGIARDDNFKKQFISFYDDLLKKSKALNFLRDERLQEKKKELHQNLEQLINEYNRIDFVEVQTIDCEIIIKATDDLEKSISLCEDLLYELDKKDKGEKVETQKSSYRENKFHYELYRLRELESSVYDLKNFLQRETVALSNLPILILNGEAGIGKSHLLADIAKKRAGRGQPSVLLLGQHFVTEENPWTQILGNLLRLNCNESEFLGALNSKAQSVGSRIIIFVDAINEGKGKYFWQNHIKSFLKSFEKYKWIGLVLSIRTSYSKLLVPNDLIGNDTAVRITHYGFAEVEYEASKMFFKNYKIEQPSVPLLHPEFQNPLFLKLFCEGISKAGLTRIPEGYEGITAIINFYLKSINSRLCDPSRLDYPENINLAEKAAKLLIQKKIDCDMQFIPYGEAFSIVENELQKYSNKRRFLDELISEGLFARNLFWDNKGNSIEGIYLNYERFEDHLKTAALIERYLDKANTEKSFSKGQKLYDFMKDEHECDINKGIIEALSIQLPELIGKELYEVAPHCKAFYPIIESFVESLIWRRTETITGKLIDYLNEFVFQYEETHANFFDTVLLIASNPKHYFNADSLHKHLMSFSLSDRDAWWTIYSHNKFNEHTSAVRRLIDWAWSEEDKKHISDESVRLTAVAVAWFLTSSNRFLRDFATKALVSLLENRIPVLIKLLKDFEGVNDPYVYERLYAVAYGCALRTDDKQGLKDLCEYIYETIFNKEYVYPHILLRDYAREAIEYTVSLGIELLLDIQKIRPPYRSDWSNELPSNEEIKKYEFDYNSADFKDYYWSQEAIIHSMVTEYGREDMMYGDFGRYVFQSAFHNWRDLDPQKLSNLAVKRIFELGYDVEKHGQFDRKIGGDGREARKPERIGKKYQWIAFHEVLAKVSDNFIMYDKFSFTEKIPLQYEGPWGTYVRDIDPTILIKKTGKKDMRNNYWWFNVAYNDWNYSHEAWTKEVSNLPDPSEIIEVKDDSGAEWLILEIYPNWSEPEKIGEEKWDVPRKDLWYQIRSYLVSKEKFKIIKKHLKDKKLMGDWMPQLRGGHGIFSREYYWSPAFKCFKKPYYGGEDWQKIRDPKTKKIIGKVGVTTEHYSWSEQYDCSKEEPISFLKPSEAIFNGLHMKFLSREGEFINQGDELICFDPSVNNKSISCLLIRKKALIVFLEKNKLEIFWPVLGEKGIIGGHFPQDEKVGWLEISGMYCIKDNKIVGYINTVNGTRE